MLFKLFSFVFLILAVIIIYSKDGHFPQKNLENYSFQATEFAAVDSQVALINPGTVEMLNGQIIIKGMEIQFNYKSFEARCSGLGTINHYAVFDTLGQGPVWGTFRLNGEGCIWEGTYNGYRKITGDSEWIDTIYMSGKEKERNLEDCNLFIVETIRTNVPFPETYRGEAQGYIIEHAQSPERNYLKAANFSATNNFKNITDPGTVEIINGQTVVKEIKWNYEFTSQESRSNGMGSVIYNVILDSLKQGPFWGVSVLNAGGGRWNIPFCGFKTVSGNSGWSANSNFFGTGSGGDIENLLYVGTERIQINSNEEFIGELKGYIIEKGLPK